MRYQLAAAAILAISANGYDRYGHGYNFLRISQNGYVPQTYGHLQRVVHDGHAPLRFGYSPRLPYGGYDYHPFGYATRTPSYDGYKHVPYGYATRIKIPDFEYEPAAALNGDGSQLKQNEVMQLIGMPLNEAIQCINLFDIVFQGVKVNSVRAIVVDGVQQFVTMDFRNDRLNVAVVGNLQIIERFINLG